MCTLWPLRDVSGEEDDGNEEEHLILFCTCFGHVHILDVIFGANRVSEQQKQTNAKSQK